MGFVSFAAKLIALQAELFSQGNRIADEYFGVFLICEFYFKVL